MGRPVLLLLLFSTGLVIVAHGERILKVITNAIPPNDDAVHDQEERDGRFMAASHSNIEETFDRLVSRYSDKLRQRVGARMLSKEIAVKEITEICGTSSSFICGNSLVGSMGSVDTDTSERCEARKKFLECIDTERKRCNELAKNGYYPILPPKNQISAIQENAWKRLWTSGACVLEA